jgi:hypothetical protein
MFSLSILFYGKDSRKIPEKRVENGKKRKGNF